MQKINRLFHEVAAFLVACATACSATIGASQVVTPAAAQPAPVVASYGSCR